jgi:hypothetical protein
MERSRYGSGTFRTAYSAARRWPGTVMAATLASATGR